MTRQGVCSIVKQYKVRKFNGAVETVTAHHYVVEAGSTYGAVISFIDERQIKVRTMINVQEVTLEQ